MQTRQLLTTTVLLLAGVASSATYTQIDLSDLPASRATAGTTAAASPGYYSLRDPAKAFTGAGMNADGITHGTTADNAMFMFAATGSSAPGFPFYLQVDLGAVTNIDRVKLFNFNFAKNGTSYTSRGIRHFKIYASTAEAGETSAAQIAATYSLVLSDELPQASGTETESGTVFDFPTTVQARHLAIVAQDDWDDTTPRISYNGLSECQLFVKDRAAVPELSICCVGDSITEGRKTATVTAQDTYRTYLAQLLSAAGLTSIVWKGSHTTPTSGNSFPHEGWSGNSAEQVANHYVENAAIDAADVLLLHAGHNYDVSTRSEESIIAAVTNAHARIISAARAQNPDVVVFDAQVITSGKLPKYSYIPTLNEAIAVLARQLTTPQSPVILVDMAEGWDFAASCTDDKVHPTSDGAREMARRWMEALKTSPVLAGADRLVEAESFANLGGWSLDTQFVEQMGSPYLLAHGLGEPVADAVTTVDFAAPGLARAWVRTRDWVPSYVGVKPGRFRLSVNGVTVETDLGVAPSTWGWFDAGLVRVPRGAAEVRLIDQTGFEGRCDALYFSPALQTNAPPNDAATLAAWRAEKLVETSIPEMEENFDLVVVGGGMAGTGAAVAAASKGLSVALIQDRPMLGGNASNEIRVKTEGEERHGIVSRIKNLHPNGQDQSDGDAARAAYAAQFPSLHVFTGWRAYGVVTSVVARVHLDAVDARETSTGARRRFRAPLFVDATGDGWIGYWAGAEYRVGREAKDEFDESYAQDAADTSTMGNSMLWTTEMAETPQDFPAVPWAMDVAKTASATNGTWRWEAGLGVDEDTIEDAEALRDKLFRAVYGNFSNAKQKSAYANCRLKWVPFNAGKRESRRIVGDYIVRQRDVENAVYFEDAIGTATWTIDLHFYDGDTGYITSTKHIQVPRWYMPYRSLCCRDVANLFLAGRCASYTHVALGSSRVMNTGAQQGVAVGYAASLCKAYSCEPREIYRDSVKTEELQRLIGGTWPVSPFAGGRVWDDDVIVDNADATGVEISGTWPASSYNDNRYGADYLHNARVAAADTWVRFTPTLPSNGLYRVFLVWNGDASRSKTVPVEVVHADGVSTNVVDMTPDPGPWKELGAWRFAGGTAGSVRLLTEGVTNGYVIADAVRFSAHPAESIVDDDGNGLPNDWERRYFLQRTGTDPMADPDGDGFSNRAEYLAGTDPTDPNSRFQLTGAAANAEAVRSITLSWPSVEGRRYQVLRAETLNESFVPYGDPVSATPPENVLDLPSTDASSSFYRVRLLD